MNHKTLLLGSFSAILLISCACAGRPASRGAEPADRDYVDADGVARRGELLSRNPALSVEQCLAQAAELDGRSVKVAGTATEVCENKGCWFIIAGDNPERYIRVRFEGYKYFAPKNARGKPVVVEGRLKVEKLSAREARHYEEDRARAAKEEPRRIEKGRTEITIFALGAEIG